MSFAAGATGLHNNTKIANSRRNPGMIFDSVVAIQLPVAISRFNERRNSTAE
jgi:hypothetical protein